MSRESLSLLLVVDAIGRAEVIQREFLRTTGPSVSITSVDQLRQGVARLNERRFDAVVLDSSDCHTIPSDAIHTIHAEAADTPIVVVTANRDVKDAVGAIRDGAQDCLAQHELNGDKLFQSILYAIERNRTERRLMRMNQTLVRRVDERTSYIRLLQDVAMIANQADTVEGALNAAINRICRFMDWPVGHGYSTIEIVPEAKPVDVWYLSLPGQFWPFYEASREYESVSGSNTSLRGAVSVGRAPLWVMDVTADDLGSTRAAAARECGLSTGFAFPVFVGQEVVALLEFFSTETSEPSDGFLSVMAHVGTQLGRVVERRRLQQQLIEAGWRKQRELGQDLHDGLGQELTGIGMLADSLARRLRKSQSEFTGASAELVDLIRRSQKNLRRVSKGLLPVDVDAAGLRTALVELAAGVESQCGIACRLRCNDDALVADNYVATHLFRIAQEAVNNAVKHARPRQINITLEHNGSTTRLQIEDDGSGFDERNSDRGGIGLKTMRYRADVIDAAFDIRSVDPKGTLVTCLIRPQE